MASKVTVGEMAAGKDTGLPDWALALTPRKLSFLQEYLVDFNGRKAVLRAKLTESEESAASMSSGLLREEDVRAALALAMADTLEARRLLRERIIQELSYVAFYSITDFVAVRDNTVELKATDELTDDQARSVKRYKQTKGKTESIEIEMHDKVKALDLLDRMNGGGAKAGGGDFNLKTDAPVTVNIDRGDAAAL